MAAIFSGSPYSGLGDGGRKEPPKTGDGARAVPPPPPSSLQISIRTMASDLEHMGRSLENTSPVAPAAPLPRILGGDAPPQADRSKFFLQAAVIAAGALVFFFVGYFFLPLVFKEESKEQGSSAKIPVSPVAKQPTSTAPAPIFMGHRSFLRSPADQTLDMRFDKPLNPAYHGIYLNDLNAVLSVSGSESDFVEVNLTRDDGQALAWTQFLNLLGIALPDADFWIDRFEPDFTFFVSRESGVWRPGYILKLKPDQSPLLLQANILKMESDSNLNRFFLNSPGDTRGGFRDAQISGQPVRALSFTQLGSVFIYGWLGSDYLVIAASEAGFRQAMLRL